MNKFFVFFCFVLLIMAGIVHSEGSSRSALESDVSAFFYQSSVYADFYPNVDYVAVGIAGIVDNHNRRGDSCVVFFHPIYVVKDESLAEKNEILGQCNADPTILVYAFGKYEGKTLILKTFSFFQNKILTPQKIENDTCKFYCMYDFLCPSDGYDIYDLFSERLFNYKNFPYDKLNKEEKKSVEKLNKKTNLYLESIKKRSDFSRFKGKGDVHVTKLKSPYVALANIISMKEEKKYLCKILLHEHYVYKKDFVLKNMNLDDEIDFVSSFDDGMDMVRSFLGDDDYVYAYKEGDCPPIQQVMFYQYVFGHGDSQQKLVIDSIKSTYDYAILNMQLVDFRMGIDFNDWLNYFLPDEISLRDYYVNVANRCKDCEGVFFYFTEKELVKKINHYCKDKKK